MDDVSGESSMKKFFFIALLLAGLGLLGWQVYEKASASKNGFQRNRRKIPIAVEVAPALIVVWGMSSAASPGMP